MTLAAPARRRKNAPAPDDRPARLLAWYDRHRRALPWRAPPGEVADPYRVWLSEIMLQQTTVKAVGPYFEKFVARWPDVAAMARASLDDVLRMWAGLGYYSRARNLHACAMAVARDHGDVFPDTEDGLRALPGIGPYTAAAIAAIAFDRRTMPVDGNIERVVSRLFAVEEALPQAKPRIQKLAATLLGPSRAGDSAQALMDLGATICTPKKTGVLRRGAAFIVLRGDEILLRTRAAKGLLGGMTEVPGSDWLAAQEDAAALAQAPRINGVMQWHRKAGTVTHVFTHFPLELAVYTARVPPRTRALGGSRWVPIAKLADEALPNVMRKAIAHGLGA